MKKTLFVILVMSVIVFAGLFWSGDSYAMGPRFAGPHLLTCDPLPANVTGTYVYWRTAGATGWSDTNRALAGLADRSPFDLLTLNLPPANYELCLTALDGVGSESGPSNTVPFQPGVPNAPGTARLR